MTIASDDGDISGLSARETTFVLREVDLRRAARLHVFSSLTSRRQLIRLTLVWLVGIVVFVAYLLIVGVNWSYVQSNLVLIALVMFAAAFGVPFVFPLLTSPLVIRRRFRQEKLLRQPVHVRWDDDVYEVEQPGVHNRIPWRDYTKWREDRRQFLFFMSDYRYQILPKQALTERQASDIRAILSVIPGWGR